MKRRRAEESADGLALMTSSVTSSQSADGLSPAVASYQQSTRSVLGKWVYLVTLTMSLFDLQDVCIAIGSLATLDLPMVVDLIGIYALKGPYLRIDGGRSIPVVDRIGGSTAAYSLMFRFPRETGRSQAPRRQQDDDVPQRFSAETQQDQISPGVPAVGGGATNLQPDVAQPAVAPTDAIQPDGAQADVAQTDLAIQRPTSEAPVASTYQLVSERVPLDLVGQVGRKSVMSDLNGENVLCKSEKKTLEDTQHLIWGDSRKPTQSRSTSQSV
ncbi:NADH dehydrogenase [Dorcoceras hygrometricum]|uniref:NADH dehydrogenase n=1 Tax=Dorcoceras hygrometricum TaxID=472368 RepID=A0A2Z7BIR4_9LAMI|nr:NADH dehydrogenase [Dorcoceras hygrometricum]